VVSLTLMGNGCVDATCASARVTATNEIDMNISNYKQMYEDECDRIVD
jgi:hypothetical protein